MKLMSFTFASPSKMQPDWKRQRRDRLLAAVIEILSQQPAEQLSMDRLSHAAGVGKATLYRYFGSREALLTACLEKIVTDLSERIEKIEESQQPPLRRFHGIVECMARTFSEHFLPLRMLMRSQGELHESWRQSVHEARLSLVTTLQRNFERGYATGTYRPVDSELLAHLVMGMIRSGVTHVPNRDLCTLVQAITDHAAKGFILSDTTRPKGTQDTLSSELIVSGNIKETNVES